MLPENHNRSLISSVMHHSSVFNFNAGPAALPQAVMENYNKLLYSTPFSGVSWLELGHRTDAFQSVVHELESSMRELLSVPKNYHLFFPPFGGRVLSSMVAMNLIARSQLGAAYVDTGLWSQLAFQEAEKQGRATVVASAKTSAYKQIPHLPLHLDQDYSYVHVVDNETAHGLCYRNIPAWPVPLVSDMTSSLLTKPIEVSRYAVVYAAAQKNLSSAGMGVLIVQDDLLNEAVTTTPTMFDFSRYLKDPTPVTPDMMAMVLALAIVHWHHDQGGLSVFASRHNQWSQALYNAIDRSSVFHAPVDPQGRSCTNLVFFPYEDNRDFAFEAEKAGLLGLRGHRSVGGLRASLYNATTEDGVAALLDWINTYG